MTFIAIIVFTERISTHREICTTFQVATVRYASAKGSCNFTSVTSSFQWIYTPENPVRNYSN